MLEEEKTPEGGTVIKILIAKILTHRRPLVKQCALLRRQNQALTAVLRHNFLPTAVENIFVMVNEHHPAMRKMRKNFLHPRVVSYPIFHVNMCKLWIKISIP